MASPTSGFTLSALPQPLSFPTNLGTFDVGQTQQAYANALKNVAATNLLAPQVRAQQAQLAYQQAKAEQMGRILSPEEEALVSQFRQQKAQSTLGQTIAEAQIPKAAQVATGEQDVTLAAQEANRLAQQKLAAGTRALIPTEGLLAQTSREAELAGARLRAAAPGGVAPINVGPFSALLTDKGVQVFPGQAGLLAQGVKQTVTGERVTAGIPTRDSAGNEIVEYTIQKLNRYGAPVSTQKVIGAPGAYQVGERAYATPVTTEIPVEEQGLFTGTPSMAPQTALSTFAPTTALGTAPTPGAALSAETAPNAPAASPTPATAPALAPAVSAGPSVFPETASIVAKYGAKGPIKLNPAAEKQYNEATAQVMETAQNLATQTAAIDNGKLQFQKIMRDGLGTGWWNKIAKQDFLQAIGFPQAQDFEQAGNNLVIAVANNFNKRFRASSIIPDLIQPAKPRTTDDPSVIVSKYNYMDYVKQLAEKANNSFGEMLKAGVPVGKAELEISSMIQKEIKANPYDKFVEKNKPISKEEANAAINYLNSATPEERNSENYKQIEAWAKSRGLR